MSRLRRSSLLCDVRHATTDDAVSDCASHILFSIQQTLLFPLGSHQQQLRTCLFYGTRFPGKLAGIEQSAHTLNLYAAHKVAGETVVSTT